LAKVRPNGVPCAEGKKGVEAGQSWLISS
jgi:hypothetical protein